MGIRDFYQVIKQRAPDTLQTYHLSEFRGYRFAVDISIFLNKYIKSAGEKAWMNTFFLFICTLKKHGIKTVCIFDGPNPPPEKTAEQERRRAEGRKALDRLKRCIEIRNIILDEYVPRDGVLPEPLQKECQSLYGKPKTHNRRIVWSECTDVLDALKFTIERLERASLPITADHRRKAKEIAEMMGLPVFQADGEAEALCAYLAIHGHADAVLTEDTDVLAYGTPWLIAFKDFKLNDEKVYGVHLESLRDELGYTQEELRDLCILLGCDYNDRVTGYPPDGKKRKKPVNIGLVGALSMIDGYRNLEEVEKHVVDSSPLIYQRCREIFTPPSGDEVLRLIKMVPLNEEPDFERIQEFIRDERLTITVDYIEKCWKPGDLIFHDSDSEMSGFDEDDDLDLKDLLEGVRKEKARRDKDDENTDEEDNMTPEQDTRFYMELHALCLNENTGDEKLLSVPCAFVSEDDFNDHNDDQFDMISEEINNFLNSNPETKGYFIDDAVEANRRYARRPEGIDILDVPEYDSL